jgi:hypothetical protein
MAEVEEASNKGQEQHMSAARMQQNKNLLYFH